MATPSRSALIKLLESRLSPRRMRHSLLVEKQAIRLAALHAEDWRRAGLGGLLHDICRDDSAQWQYGYLRANGAALDSAWMKNPQIWHGLCGSIYLRRELGIRDRELLSAVRYHTTGRAGMSELEKIVCIADKTSDDRTFEGAQEARELACRSTDGAMLEYLRYSLESAAKTGLPLVRESWEAYNEYSQLTGKDDIIK